MSVCVLDASDSRLPDAGVAVVGTAHEARTGQDGCASIHGVPVGDAVIYVTPREQWWQPTHSGNQRWRRDAVPVAVSTWSTADVRIRVPYGDTSYGSDPDRPLAGVRNCGLGPDVHLAGASVTLVSGGITRTQVADGDGCYAFDRLTPGPASLRVSLLPGTGVAQVNDSHTAFDEPWRTFTVEPDAWTAPRRASTTPCAQVRGRLTDDAGNPIAGQSVELVNAAGRTELWMSTDADGRFSRIVTPGDYQLVSVPGGGALLGRYYGGTEFDPGQGRSGSGTVVHAGAGEDVSGLDIALTRKAVLTGRVLDESGAPASGASAQAVTGADGKGFGGLDYQLDPDGRFAMHVNPGTVRLYAQGKNALTRWYGGSDGFAGAASIEAAPGAVIDGLDVVVSRGSAVSGKVVDTAGKPVPQIQVSVVHETPAQAALTLQPWTISPTGEPFAVVDVVTDAEGRWTTGQTVRSGRYVLRAVGRTDSDWAPTTYGGDVGIAPIVLTVRQPEPRGGVTIVMRHVGEPVLVATSAARRSGDVVTLPIACPTGCSVELRAAPAKARATARKRRPILARGRGKAGATQVRLRLTHAGRQAVAHRRLRVTARVRPVKGPARSFTVRLARPRR